MVAPEGVAQAWMALRNPLFYWKNGRRSSTAILTGWLKLRV